VSWALHLLGVGNAGAAPELGAAAAVIECDGEPVLMIDAGQEAITAFHAAYGRWPTAVFITHVHMDHVAGLERLFYAAYFDPALRGRMRLYVPAGVMPHLRRRLADYPEPLAEGGANFWDAFQLVPVSALFWHAGRQYEAFEARHHRPGTAFGLRRRGSVVWTGDTRPIPEVLSTVADEGELVAHDCGLPGNPSHTGLDDLEREYPADLRARCLLYH
jgi:ribonuclease BN (tRNA processing enzyme)